MSTFSNYHQILSFLSLSHENQNTNQPNHTCLRTFPARPCFEHNGATYNMLPATYWPFLELCRCVCACFGLVNVCTIHRCHGNLPCLLIMATSPLEVSMIPSGQAAATATNGALVTNASSVNYFDEANQVDTLLMNTTQMGDIDKLKTK